MSDFFRKAHLKTKGLNGESVDSSANTSSDGGSSPVMNRPSTLSRPPNSRSASNASSIHSVDSDSGSHPKRRHSLAKTKKRLASLFSSSSLDTHAGDSEKDKRKHSHSPNSKNSTHVADTHHLRPSPLSTTPSSASTATYTRLGMKRQPSSLSTNGDTLSKDLNGLAITSAGTNGLTSSPISASPMAIHPPAGSPMRERTESLFSRYDLEDEDSDEDDVFLTPSEGLSEVEEGDEDEGVVGPVVPVNTSTPKNVLAAHSDVNDPKVNPTNDKPFDADNVHKGSLSTTGDVLGTGPSTLRRSRAAIIEVTVKQRTHKPDPHSIDQTAVLGEDVDTTRELLVLFLRSQMREAEEVCAQKDPEGVHMYLQVAYCIFQAIKGMMTFDAHDLTNALEISKNVQTMATSLRKPSDGLMSRFGSLVKSGAGVQRLKGMTVMERHAELVYAESSLFKALLAIVAGGDWFGMIREALSMRAAWGIYRTMQTYIEEMDSHGYDDDIDMDFRSGVALGSGTSSLMLSLLPGKVLKIAEVFGYGGDRDAALKILYSAGGWTKDSDVPVHDEFNEGLRRPVVDLILLAFHLVISLLMPVAGVDIPMAKKILMYNMRIYPDGIFFLYFQARLRTAECNPDRANESLQQALDLKLEYVQLQHMVLWDYANNHTMLGNWKGALDCYNILREESNWSRAVYTYSTAACIVELVADGHPGASLLEAEKLMKEVPKLTKKLAGKSLPIEKLVSRKTRKFEHQSHRLFLPGIELAYVFGSLSHAPRRALMSVLIPRIDKRLAELEETGPETYGRGYWDDFCLGHFLRGVCKAIARYQPPHADEEAKAVQPEDPSDAELDEGAEKDLLAVIKHSPDVELDHYISYHCHFELGKLYGLRGEKKAADKQFDIVMSGKLTELNRHEQKAQGKYSLEGALLMKTHSAKEALQNGNLAA